MTVVTDNSIKGPTDAMVEAGEEALREHTDRYFDGSEVVQGGAVETILAAVEATRTATNPAAEGDGVEAAALAIKSVFPGSAVSQLSDAELRLLAVAALSAKPASEPTQTELVEWLRAVADLAETPGTDPAALIELTGKGARRWINDLARKQSEEGSAP